jgi:quercetin dioxygenase-like cupin family protein
MNRSNEEATMPSEKFGPNVLTRSEDSEGRVSVIEIRLPGDFGGPPLHKHDFDEAFYVLEGELTFQVEEEVFTAGSGELIFAPGGIVHAVANHSGEVARYLLVCTPAGFERHFDRMAAERDGVEPPASASGPIPEVTRVGPQIQRRETGD